MSNAIKINIHTLANFVPRGLSAILKNMAEIRRNVLGINRRNSQYIFRHNPIELSSLVDDKILTKKILTKKNIPVPKMIGSITSYFAMPSFHALLGNHPEFVIKPSNGFGGEGVLVIQERRGKTCVAVDGSLFEPKDIQNHLRDILSGVYSLSQMPDSVLIEERLHPHDGLSAMTYKGIPDIRVLLLHGVPAMAMLRLSTLKSKGRANLHQGGIGVGIDLATGTTTHAIYSGDYITHHPDNNNPLIGQTLPDWLDVLTIASKCYEAIPLGYMGADVVIDPQKGPMILELNLRPGLMIQMANHLGSKNILSHLNELKPQHLSVAEKVEFGIRTFKKFQTMQSEIDSGTS